mmetsp:Transcript_45383/g.135696  ORF Transcript_45383/g.135696 Transcript_45383/m.135696 type:complete len:278 (+) Transcript_45383:139-972(+)
MAYPRPHPGVCFCPGLGLSYDILGLLAEGIVHLAVDRELGGLHGEEDLPLLHIHARDKHAFDAVPLSGLVEHLLSGPQDAAERRQTVDLHHQALVADAFHHAVDILAPHLERRGLLQVLLLLSLPSAGGGLDRAARSLRLLLRLRLGGGLSRGRSFLRPLRGRGGAGPGLLRRSLQLRLHPRLHDCPHHCGRRQLLDLLRLLQWILRELQSDELSLGVHRGDGHALDQLADLELQDLPLRHPEARVPDGLDVHEHAETVGGVHEAVHPVSNLELLDG